LAAKNLLLVEGKDDQHVFWNLLEHHRVPETFLVKEVEGVDNAFDRLAETLEVQNNTVPGMLEHFIAFLVPQGDVLWEQAKKCLDEIEENRRFPEMHLAKAHIHTWLAWQQEPGTPIGQAITKRYLNAEAPQAQQLVRWINRLFNE
jgi:hypothetical protein